MVVPHSKTLPPSDDPSSVLAALQRGLHRSNLRLSKRAGYEDGRWPDGPQWGEPGTLYSTILLHYRHGRRQGSRDRQLFLAAVPVEFEHARRWLAGREDVGDRALKLSDEEAFDAIRSRYIGGWHAFVTERARAGR